MRKSGFQIDKRKYHFVGKISDNGDMSAYCFDPPRKINIKREYWTFKKSAVTCKKCLAKLKTNPCERSEALPAGWPD
jgi:hypothetical protein